MQQGWQAAMRDTIVELLVRLPATKQLETRSLSSSRLSAYCYAPLMRTVIRPRVLHRGLQQGWQATMENTMVELLVRLPATKQLETRSLSSSRLSAYCYAPLMRTVIRPRVLHRGLQQGWQAAMRDIMVELLVRLPATKQLETRSLSSSRLSAYCYAPLMRTVIRPRVLHRGLQQGCRQP